MRRVLFFTGTRADYGILYPLIKKLSVDSAYHVEILATGTHLSQDHGATIAEIKRDGFAVRWPVDIQVSNSDSVEDSLSSMASGIRQFGHVLAQAKPELVVLLGDRYEALAFAVVCQFYQVPIAHLHGGELTLGAIDDSFRHAITKMSYLHFVAAQEYADRVVRLGESPDRVYNVGALGVENALSSPLLSRNELSESLGIKFKNNNVVVTFHPVTLEKKSSSEQLNELLGALGLLRDHFEQDILFIITLPNVDPGSEAIFKKLQQFNRDNPQNSVLFSSMGRTNYLSALAVADVVIGNSSSGIIEAPAFKIPTINIGDRQEGRSKASSILDCTCEKKSIFVTSRLAIEQKKAGKYAQTKSLFGEGDTSSLIKSVIDGVQFPLDMRKRFYEKDI